ncbi:MAG: DUF6474 family protein [Gordonia sp. (in: high G+C Gram-positive bacteria)]|uniref:DUF6474 family protein n=1 Tax=Gordonia sp. (in: high G+C Gram-positive bacteria) TaxID=84139 RepID=UPI0039E53321
MGLFSGNDQTRAERKAAKKARRADAKAATKAAKKRAKYEAKYDAKERRAERKRQERGGKRDERRSAKLSDRQHKREVRAQTQQAKHESKAAVADAKVQTAKIEAAANKKKLTRKNAKRVLSVAQIVAPIAAPIVYRGGVVAREKLHDYQASKHGVAPETLRQFTGKGAPLAARIATTRQSLRSLTITDTSTDSVDFASAMDARLDNLTVAVDAAESMTPSARKNAHRAIGNELSAIDADILARLGVATH